MNPKFPNGLLPDEFASFDENKFIEFVKEQVALDKLFPKKEKEVQNKIINFYLNSKDAPPKKDYLFYLRKYAQVSRWQFWRILWPNERAKEWGGSEWVTTKQKHA